MLNKHDPIEYTLEKCQCGWFYDRDLLSLLICLLINPVMTLGWLLEGYIDLPSISKRRCKNCFYCGGKTILEEYPKIYSRSSRIISVDPPPGVRDRHKKIEDVSRITILECNRFSICRNCGAVQDYGWQCIDPKIRRDYRKKWYSLMSQDNSTAYESWGWGYTYHS